MKKFPRFILTLMVVTLVGCGTATRTTDPTTLPSPSSTDITITQTATRLPTATRRATATLRPSATPSITPTPDLTQVAIYDALLTEYSAELTLVPQFLRACDVQHSPPAFSPDRLWMKELCYSESDQDLIMTLSKQEPRTLWKVSYRKHLFSPDFIPDGGMSIVKWSNDGRYAYFNTYLATSGGECFIGGNVSSHGTGLFRIDLNSGNTNTILPPRENFVGYSFSFSPTERRLIYESRSSINILDLKTGQVIAVSSAGELSEAEGYLWSPDGLQLVYSTVLFSQGNVASYSIRVANSQTGTEKILMESPENCFAARTWTDDNIITIEVYDKNYDRTLIGYDLNSNTVIHESTAMPSP